MKREKEMHASRLKTKSSPKNTLLLILLLIGLSLIYLSGQMTGFFSYEPSTIEFDVNDSWNLSETLVRVSIAGYSSDLPATGLLSGGKIVVDAQALQLNRTGTLYADLIVSNELVDSKHIDIREAQITEQLNQNETLAENSTDQTANETAVQTNQTDINNATGNATLPEANQTDEPANLVWQKKEKQYKKAHEIAAKITDKEGDEGTLVTETEGDKITLRATKGKTMVEIKGLRTATDFEIKTGRTKGHEIIAVQESSQLETIEIDNATITLPKTREIRAIGYCADDDFDFEAMSCSQWQITSIPFVDNGDTITFTVEHFSAYSGLSAVILSGVNLSKYAVSSGQAVNYSGLVAWYRLEKGNGSFWNDSSGNGRFGVGNGSSAAAPTHTYEGSTGGAYKFDGTDDFITNGTATTASGGNGISISAWLKHNAPNIKNITTGEDHTCALMTNGDIYCWGFNLYGQVGDGTTTDRNIPTKTLMTSATTISLGSFYTCATNSSGMYCWGGNGNGQFGNGSTATTNEYPTKNYMTNSTATAAGQYHLCATNTSGMYCWGDNTYGAIGNGSTATTNEFPTLNQMTAPTMIITGDYYTCATNSSGMYCWGINNNYGQVGDGTTTDRYTPTRNLMTSPTAINPGRYHLCATNTSGMYCWGSNEYGEIGNGSTTSGIANAFPTKNYMTAATAITAGDGHTCATNTTGMYCWGHNAWGQIGNGSTATINKYPTLNFMAAPTAIAIGNAALHTCATNSSGMYCWGYNIYGQIGNGSMATTNEFPTRTVFEILTLSQNAFGIAPNWITITLVNITANRTDGNPTRENLYGNTNWQLLTITKDATTLKAYKNGALAYTIDDTGNANVTLTTIGRSSVASHYNGSIDELTIWNRSLTLTEILNLYNRTKNIYKYHSLGASIVNSSEPASNTSVSYSYDWRLFNTSIALVNMPFDLNGSVGAGNWTTAADYSSFANHAYYNGSAAAMPRWNSTAGYDSKGAYTFDGIDDYVTVNANASTANMTLNLWLKINAPDIKNITTGEYHTCALMTNGDTYCWGINTYGELGDGTATQRNIPTKTLMTAATMIATGVYNTCATNTTGMYCWGLNQYGEVGDGTATQRNTPTKNYMTAPTMITAGNGHTCAVNTSGMYCWGRNVNGGIGNGSTATTNPFPTLNMMTAPTMIAAGGVSNGGTITCAVNTSGMYCWGAGDNGGIGNGSTATINPFPTKNYMTAPTQIAISAASGASRGTTCAVNTSGMYCWGVNEYGEMGNGSTGSSITANPFPTKNLMTNPTQIAAGNQHTCAYNSSGMYCWGYNFYGQIGNGSTSGANVNPFPTKNYMTAPTMITAGYYFTCATNTTGTYCWGYNAYGQLGNGSLSNALIPQRPVFEIVTLAMNAFSTTPDWMTPILQNITRSSTITTRTNIDPTQWQMLTITKNLQNLTVYKNGANIYYLANSSNIATRVIEIGRMNANMYFNGTIDQLTFYNRTLSPQQIQAMYADGAGGYNRLVSQETAENDNWTVVATPIDGDMDGLAYTSNMAEVLQKLTINWTATYNASGVQVNTTTWLAGNATFNATILDPDNLINTVWVVIWSTIKDAGNILWQGIMTLVNGVYSVIAPTDSFKHNVNYSIYANDTTGAEVYVNGTFFYNYKPAITAANLAATLSNNYTTENLSISGITLTDSDGDTANYTIDWRINNTSIALLNLLFDLNGTGGSIGNWTTVRDYSSYGNNAVYNGSVAAMPRWNRTGGYNGLGAYKFDGINDHMIIAGVNKPNTTSLWFNNGTGWFYYANSSGTYYLNGESAPAIAPPIYTDGTNLYIGKSSSTAYFNGTIDQVMVFNRTLSPDQIAVTYNAGAGNYGIIVKNETTKGQSWQAAITPNDAYEDGNTSLTANLTIRDYPPGMPTLVTTNNTNTTDTTPTLTWANAADNDTDALTYILEVSSATDFSIINYTNKSVAQTSNITNDTTITLADNTYYWRVRANDGTENSTWSSPYYTLTIDTTGPNITLVNLTNATGAIINTTQTTIRNQNLTLTINATDPTDINTIIATIWQTTETAGTKLYAKTISITSGLWTTSDIYLNLSYPKNAVINYTINATDMLGNLANYRGNFTISNTPPKMPTLLSPINNTNTTDTTPTLTWANTTDNDTDARTYILEVSSTTDFSIVNYTNKSIAETSNITNDTTTTLADGRYYWRARANDGEDNSTWSTPYYTLTIDTTGPNITLVNVTNQTGAIINTTQTALHNQNLTFSVNATDDRGVQSVLLTIWQTVAETGIKLWEGLLSLVNGLWQTSEVFLNLSYNKNAIINYTINATDMLGNLANYKGNFTVGNTQPQPPVLLSPGNLTNVTTGTPTFTWANSTDNDSDAPTYILEVSNDFEFTDIAYTNKSIAGTSNTTNDTAIGLTSGTRYWRVRANDGTANSSWSVIYNISVVAAPIITNVTANPNTTMDVDPNVQINVTATIASSLGISTAILQYKESSEATWTNKTMYNTSTTGYVSNFTTGATEAIYNYRIWANSSGGTAYSDQYNTTSQFEYSWNTSWLSTGTKSLGSVSTLLNIGTIIDSMIINNTGDAALTFDLSDNSPYGVSYNYSEPFSLAAKGVRILQVNATGASTTREDDFSITASASHALITPVPTSNMLNATIASYAGGPYFDVVITSYPTSVTQSTKNHIFAAYVKNLGNVTATNSTITWTLPTGWTNQSNMTQTNINVTSSGGKYYINLTATATSSANASATNTIMINATSQNNASDSTSVTVIVSCNTTDSACGAGCTTLTDPVDCGLATTTEAAAATTGGGGGGGGSAGVSLSPARKLLESNETFEVVRGTTEEFIIVIKNPYVNSTLENIRVTITGFLSQYVEMPSSMPTQIRYNQSANITVKIKAPTYMRYGNYTLQAKITGDITKGGIVTQMIETRSINLLLQEVSLTQALTSINTADRALKDMIEAGFATNKTKRLLEKARDSIDNRRYKQADDLAKEIISTAQEAFDTNKVLGEVQRGINEAKTNGLRVTETERVYGLALAAFQLEDYNTASKRINEAKFSLVLETKGKVNIAKFVINNWWKLLIAMAMLAVMALFSYNRMQAYSIIRKLRDIDKEELSINEMMKQAQVRCFRERKITVSEYHKLMYRYNKRVEELRHRRLNLRSKRVNMFKLSDELKSIMAEKEYLLDLIKSVQKDYFQTKISDWDTYKIKMEALVRRKAEVQKDMIMAEARRRIARAEKAEKKTVSRKELNLKEARDLSRMMEKTDETLQMLATKQREYLAKTKRRRRH